MDETHLEQARELAKLPYSVTVSQDEATDGTPLLFVANDELKGCMAQGTSIDEALANLEEARIDYLASLLEDGLEIPVPEQMRTVTSGGTDGWFEASVVATNDEPSFPDDLERVTDGQGHSTPYRVVLQT